MNSKALVVTVVVVALICGGVVAAFVINTPQQSNDTDTSKDVDKYIHELKENFPVIEESDVSQYLDDSQVLSKSYSISSSMPGYRYIYSTHKANNTYDEIMNLGTMDSIYYPGAVLAMSYDANGNKVIKSINLERSPMSLSVGLETATGVNSDKIACSVDNPTLSTVRTAVNDMVNGTIVTGSSIPCVLSCEIVEIDSSESLSIAVGADANIGAIEASVDVAFDESSSRTHAALILKQVYYTVDMDRPISASGVFKDVTYDEMVASVGVGSNLVYCSVVYGKVAIITIDTDKSMDSLKASFNASFGSAFELSASINSAWADSNTSMSYFIYGGDVNSEVKVIQQSNISDAVANIVNNPTSSPKAIGYRFYNLDDGTLASFSEYSEYVTRENIPIEVENLSIHPVDHGNDVVAGEAVEFTKTVNPTDAIVYTSENYTVKGNPSYAYIQTSTEKVDVGGVETDRIVHKLIIEDDAPVDTKITVVLTIKQTIAGKIVQKTAEYEMNIVSIPATSVELSISNRTHSEISDSSIVYRGEVITLDAAVNPNNATCKEVSWVYNGEVVSVSGGQILNVTGTQLTFQVPDNASGKISVIARHSDGPVCSMSMDVQVPLTSIVLERQGTSVILSEKRTDAMIFGEQVVVSAVLDPSDATISAVTWTVVGNGTYTAVGEKNSSIIITATSSSGNITISASVGGINALPITLQVYDSASGTKSYSVRFYDDANLISTTSVADGDTIQLSSVPSPVRDDVLDYINKSGKHYQFMYWAIKDTNTSVDLNTYEVKSDIDLEAVWSATDIAQYTIKFYDDDPQNGGNVCKGEWWVFEGYPLTYELPALSRPNSDGYSYSYVWKIGGDEVNDWSTRTYDESTSVVAEWTETDLIPDFTRISTADDFKKIKLNMSGKYFLMADIDLTSDSAFMPIGDNSSGAYEMFTGELDGNGKTVRYSLSYVPHTYSDIAYTGLFSIIGGSSSIHDLCVDASIYIDRTGGGTKLYCIGAICGSLAGGSISNCTIIDATISTKETTQNYRVAVGGVTGLIDGTSLVYNVTVIHASVAAYAFSTYCGGIVGYIRAGSSDITNCTIGNENSVGDVSMTVYGYAVGTTTNRTAIVGGVAGLVDSNLQPTITDCSICCNMRTYQGAHRFAGGIIGVLWPNSTTINCSDCDYSKSKYYDKSSNDTTTLNAYGHSY